MKTRLVLIGLVLLAAHARGAPSPRAQDFVAKLERCIEFLEAKSSRDTYQIIFGRGWQVQVFEVPARDGGGLGVDLCGEIDGAPTSGFAMPEALGWSQIAAGARLQESSFDRVWLRKALAKAEAALPKKAGNALAIDRVTVSLLPGDEQFLVRVFFTDVQLEQQAEAPAAITVDLNAALEPIARDRRVPDELAPRKPTTAPTVLEKVSAPSVDPEAAWRTLRRSNPEIAEASMARVIFSNFAADVNFYLGSEKNMQQSTYNFIDGQEYPVETKRFEFPAAFKKCALTAKQVESAITGIKKHAKYRELAPRLLHLILECRAERGKALWSMTAMEPFEYLDVPATY